VQETGQPLVPEGDASPSKDDRSSYRETEMTIEKAWSLLEVKAIDEDRRTLTGWATTPTVDRVFDIVDPDGMVLRGPVKLHLYHKHDMPVGNVAFGKPSKKGIPFEASLPDVKEEGTVRERVNEALHSLKYKLLDAVSIGFRAIEAEPIAGSYGTRFKRWEMLELSLVGVPANPDAVITAFKSCDSTAIRSALGLGFPSRSGPVPLVRIAKAAPEKLPGGAIRLVQPK
jgi:uncharacterized protein